MRADLSTDTLIRLMREVFAEETLAFERRARIHARITANPSAQGMELWANPATPFDESSVGVPCGVRQINYGCSQTMKRRYLRSNQPCLCCVMDQVSDAFTEALATTRPSDRCRNLITEKALLDLSSRAFLLTIRAAYMNRIRFVHVKCFRGCSDFVLSVIMVLNISCATNRRFRRCSGYFPKYAFFDKVVHSPLNGGKRHLPSLR